MKTTKLSARIMPKHTATPDSAVRVLIVQTQEDWMIARECRRLAEQK